MEKWYEIKKGADFQAIAERFGISPVTARLIRNRGVIGDAAIDKYLNGICFMSQRSWFVSCQKR